MSPGAKVFLTLAGVGTVIGVVMIAGAKNASAATSKPKPQIPGDNTPPDLIVPPLQQQQPPPQQLPSLPNIPIIQQAPQQPAQPLPPLPPLPQPPLSIPPLQQQNPQQQVPPGVTFSIPNPLGGSPLGTFDPATGNVFGPGGLIIGTFNPASGIFTTLTGQQVKIPSFGPAQQPAPPAPQSAQPQPAVQTAPPSVPVVPPTPVAAAPVATVPSDTAAMVSALLDAEATHGWNTTDPNVQVFQKNRGLTADAKFGPGTALKTALEIGTLPLIRFWPLGSTKAKLLASYKAALLDLANKSSDPARAQQLRLSASREDARAYSTKGGLPAIPLEMQVALAKVA